jgi:hypothetical protein
MIPPAIHVLEKLIIGDGCVEVGKNGMERPNFSNEAFSIVIDILHLAKRSLQNERARKKRPEQSRTRPGNTND